MKVLTIPLICLQLTFSQTLLAGDYMDQAREVTRKSLDAAQKDAHALVQYDMDQSLMNILGRVAQMQDSVQLKESLIEMQQELELSLSQIIAQNPEDIAKSLKTVMKLRDQYQKVVRTKFEQSFRSAQTRYDNQKILDALTLIAKDFQNKCENGRSASGLTYYDGVSYENLPEYYSKTEVGFTEDGELSISYEGSTANDTQLQKDLQALNAVLTTATTITTSIAYGGATTVAVAGGMSAATAASVISYASTVAPYLIAVAAAVAVVSDFVLSAEHAKLQNDVANANQHLLAEMADDFDVNHFYKQACIKQSEMMESIKKTVILAQDPKHREELKEEALKTTAQREQWKTESSKNRENTLLIKLNSAYEKEFCSLEDDSLCTFDTEKIWLTRSPEVSLPRDEDDREEMIESIQKKIEQYNKIFDNNTVAKYIRHEIAENLVFKLDAMSSLLENITWNKVNMLQKQAFQKLVQVLSIYRNYKASEQSLQISKIEGDLTAQRKFETLKKRYRVLVSKLINNILGHVSIVEVNQEVNSLAPEIKKFSKEYFHVSAVKAFYKQYKELMSYFNGN